MHPGQPSYPIANRKQFKNVRRRVVGQRHEERRQLLRLSRVAAFHGEPVAEVEEVLHVSVYSLSVITVCR